MLDDTKVIIDSHTKTLLDSIANRITDEIAKAFDASKITDSIEELIEDGINPMEERVKRILDTVNKIEKSVVENNEWLRTQFDATIEAVKNCDPNWLERKHPED